MTDSQKFDFVQCWTCRHLVFDVAEGYVCQKTSQHFKRYEITQPTDCAHWTRG